MDESALKRDIESRASATVTSMQRLAAGNTSVNFKVVLSTGDVILVKWAELNKIKVIQTGFAVVSQINHALLPRPVLYDTPCQLAGGVVMALEWKDGCSIPYERLTKRQVSSLLEAMASVSSALKSHSGPIRDSLLPEIPLARQMAVHGDLNFNNVLFNGESVSAILDFDFIRLGLPAEDLVYGFIHRAERLNFFAFRSRRLLVERFEWLVACANIPIDEWRLAIKAYQRQKQQRRAAKHNFLVMYFEAWLRNPFYHKLHRVLDRLSIEEVKREGVG